MKTHQNIFKAIHRIRLSAALVLASVLLAMAATASAAAAATLSAGWNHTCALSDEGGVKCWGGNSLGQLGDGGDGTRAEPVDVIGLQSGITAVVAGSNHTCALTSAGSVKCWGYNSYGQLGNGSTEDSRVPVDVVGLGPGVTALGAGRRHTCAVTAAGALKCWGDNGSGQLGNGSQTGSATPVGVVGMASGTADVQASWQHTCAVTTAGAMKCWGENASGLLGDGTYAERSTPVDVVGLASGVTAFTTAIRHACAITDGGEAKCWGSNFSGELGNGNVEDSPIPVSVTAVGLPVEAIAAGQGYTCVLLDAGDVQCWGSNDMGELGNGTLDSSSFASQVSGLDAGVTAIASGMSHVCARLPGDELRCWGLNFYGQLGNGVYAVRPTAVSVDSSGTAMAAIAGGSWHTCGVSVAGGALCWGDNWSGQLGDGTSHPHPRPAPVDGLSSGVAMIGTGEEHSCAMTNGGMVLCWGGNGFGQLGSGNYGSLPSPVMVLGFESGARRIAVGDGHSCAVTTIGGLKCWGLNTSGQLGDGAPTSSGQPTPVQVVGLTSGIVDVAPGRDHTCALTESGSVKCWGQNDHGQLGDGTLIDHALPADVVGLAGPVVAIASGGKPCALIESGIVQCWGGGQLTPTIVPGLTGISVIAAGSGHFCALDGITGGLKCWGDNGYGQLGDGSLSDSNSPVTVTGITDATAVTVGGYHSCAVLAGGAAKCWGWNAYGQLGNGEAGYALVPGRVVGTPFAESVFRNGFD